VASIASAAVSGIEFVPNESASIAPRQSAFT
jgi:hypothetical protein